MTKIDLGKWSQEGLNGLLRDSSRLKDAGSRIEFLSRHFLGTPYRESTLEGSAGEGEILIINLDGVDCFTFVDYVEAMRHSGSFEEFAENLRRVRYRTGRPSHGNRNHFFTDWIDFNPDFVEDVTADIGGDRAVTVRKRLNERENGSPFIPRIPPKEREITYIPAEALDASIIAKLETGDYTGIYSPLPGLDVSHVGIVIRKGRALILRHASSASDRRKVVDQDLADYLRAKPGLLVLRPR